MHTIIIGLIIGIASGFIQFLLLYNFVTSVTGGNTGRKTVIFAITQFLFPFAVLLMCGLFLTDTLMWVGIGMGASLITSAIIKFFIIGKSDNIRKSTKKSKSTTNEKPKKSKSATNNKHDKNAKSTKSAKSAKSKKSSKSKKK